MPTSGKTTHQSSEVERSVGNVRGHTLLPGRTPLHRRGGPAGRARLRALHQGHGGLCFVLFAGPPRERKCDSLSEGLRGSTKRRREEKEGHGGGGGETRRASLARAG